MSLFYAGIKRLYSETLIINNNYVITLKRYIYGNYKHRNSFGEDKAELLDSFKADYIEQILIFKIALIPLSTEGEVLIRKVCSCQREVIGHCTTNSFCFVFLFSGSEYN